MIEVRIGGMRMTEVRRGVQNGAHTQAWHTIPACPDYPTRNFVIAEMPFAEESVCPKCRGLANGHG